MKKHIQVDKGQLSVYIGEWFFIVVVFLLPVHSDLGIQRLCLRGDIKYHLKTVIIVKHMQQIFTSILGLILLIWNYINYKHSEEIIYETINKYGLGRNFLKVKM